MFLDGSPQSGRWAPWATAGSRCAYLDFVEAASRFGEVSPVTTDAQAYDVLSRNTAAYSMREQARAALPAS